MKRTGERAQIKATVHLYQISSAALPEAGETPPPIPLSARSPIKLRLQSKIVSLYQTYFISKGTLHLGDSRRPDSWLICAQVSYAVPVCFPISPLCLGVLSHASILRLSSTCLCVLMKSGGFIFPSPTSINGCVSVKILNNYVAVHFIRLSVRVAHTCVFDVCVCVWFGGRLMCLSPFCCFPPFVSCCCLDRHRLAGDGNKWRC